jgi:DNA-directed RNA polymerase specialized sigma subunit
MDLNAYRDLLYDDNKEAMLTIIADCISRMSERCNQIISMFYYEEKNLDDILEALPSFKSKDALKTAKHKCMENLRKTAQGIYHRYLNA